MTQATPLLVPSTNHTKFSYSVWRTSPVPSLQCVQRDSIDRVRELSVSLDAVIVSVTNDSPRILLIQDVDGSYGLPTGPLDTSLDDTLDLGLRRLVASQTGVKGGYVEQLYTFGDENRSGSRRRDLAIGYVALTNEETPEANAAWWDIYDIFPWEDRRDGTGGAATDDIIVALADWSQLQEDRVGRQAVTFGDGAPWDPIAVLERYELLYEAVLVQEAGGEPGFGLSLARDHRRIVAVALGRLRGKLTYRPVIFEVVADTFTLTHLQTTVEAIVGMRLHKQNFRRIVDRGELVEPTGESTSATGGRPAELYRFRSDVVGERPRPGFPLPRPARI